MTTAADTEAEPGEQSPLFRFGEREHRTRAVVHSLTVVAGAFLLGMVLALTGRGLLQSAGVTAETAPLVAELVPTALHFLGLLGGVAIYLDRGTDLSLFAVGRPTLADAGWAVAGFLALVATLVGIDALLSTLGFEPATNAAVEIGREHPRLFLYFIPLVVLLNAPAEELLFRGLVQGLFRRAYGVVPGILAAAAIFGLVHYAALVGAGSKGAYVFIAVASGIVLGALYERTDNMLVPVAVHACWNILVYVQLYAGAVGML